MVGVGVLLPFLGDDLGDPLMGDTWGDPLVGDGMRVNFHTSLWRVESSSGVEGTPPSSSESES